MPVKSKIIIMKKVKINVGTIKNQKWYQSCYYYYKLFLIIKSKYKF